MKCILLADDNSDLRSALHLLLKIRFGLECILEAGDIEGALAQLQATNPDCIILDWELPGCPTSDRMRLLKTLAPGLKVIALSLRPESETAALEAGVEAFICKTESPTAILNEIQKLIRSERSHS